MNSGSIKDDPSTVPAGCCQCGCGSYVGFWEHTDRAAGQVKGEPKRFWKGHNRRTFGSQEVQAHKTRWAQEAPDIPYGYCQCGCGEPAPVAKRNDRNKGRVKGEPLRFIAQHHARKSPLEYVEEDRGHDTPCWIWQRSADGWDYGQLWVADGEGVRTKKRAHRHYYETQYGPIPGDLPLDHLCRVSLCVNPDHLEPVTIAENNRRAISTSLDEEKVRAIWRLSRRGDMTIVKIAMRLRVGRGAVRGVLNGTTWLDVSATCPEATAILVARAS